MSAPARAPRPLTYWASGGDVLMRLDGNAIRLDDETQRDLLSLFEDERRAALAHPRCRQSDAWITAMEKHNELSQARIEAARWNRAGQVVRP